LFFLLQTALLLPAAQSGAVDIEPRSFVNTPVGINFLVTAYAYSEGGLATEGSSPLQNAQLRMHTGVLGYARTLDIFGKNGLFDVVLPYSNLSGSALFFGQPRERDVSGFHDPLFRFTVNFYGAPALTMPEFADYRQNVIIGARVQVSAPLGQYDRDRLVNLGNNRWFVRPGVGLSKAWGPLTLELSGGATFFSVNDDYLGGHKLEQDPLGYGRVHVSYSLGHGFWVAWTGTYDFGGRTTVDGVPQNNVVNNWETGLTLAIPLDRNNSIKLYGSKGLYTQSGTNVNLIGIIWQYRWGQGL
jgi:hypothetical protein